MLAKQLASIFLVPVLVLCNGTVLGEDFSKYDNEVELFKMVRAIPASDRSANADGYARLLALNPDNEFYWSRFERYAGSDESALFKVVRGIPASNRSANANGYARLLALDPNNDLYKTKLQKYAVPTSRPRSFTSVSGLGFFLAGSWCVLDNDPTYVSGPYVEKLVVLKDGNYTLFSKRAAALEWESTREKGRFEFGEGRYSTSGERYFSATPEYYGSPKLLVDANDFSVAWHRGARLVGTSERDGCRKFE